ncbi:MAG: glycosyltransferase [Sphingobacteriales bacterium]|nr:MAG: glycosyltransferase [Sphingobacteriales bacterium]
MPDKRIRLLMITNSLPLPSSDFLKDKVIGLSDMFDLHLLCWDTTSNKAKFIRKYPGVNKKNIHVYPNQKGFANQLWVLLTHLILVLTNPSKYIRLFRSIQRNSTGIKKAIHDFVAYAPMVQIKPDIVHFEFGTLAATFRDIKDYFQVKVSSSFRGYDLNYVALDRPDYYTKVWSSFDGYHFLGNDLRSRAVKRGYRHNRFEALISPAIDTSLFQPEEKKASEKLIIISTGRLVWKKGYEYGIRAVARLKEKGIPFEYRIIGDGEHLQAIQFTIYELGLEHDVILLGKKNKTEIKKLLSEGDVFLHPAISEGFCNAVLEAQAMGLPVVTTDADGLSENIMNGITGFVVPKWDVAAMADKLEWCAGHPAEAQAMGRKGIERIASEFRLEDQLDQFRNFYQKLYYGADNG